MAWNLNFITKEDFKKHVQATILKYGEKLESFDLKRFNSNLIDPIKLIFDKSALYVEMKNKHNTMNSASSAKTYIKMQSQILDDDDCACLLVEAIAKCSQNIKWTTKVDGKNV